MKSKPIVVTEIEVDETANGSEVLVVTDGNMNEWVSPDPYLINRFRELTEDQEDRYIGERWVVAFEESERDKVLRGFLTKAVMDEEISYVKMVERAGDYDD